MTSKLYSVTIIGGGPRGLSALESLYRHVAIKNPKSKVTALLVEACELPGAGHVYDVTQADTNWLNISERGLTLPAREELPLDTLVIPSFPSYHDWANYEKTEVGEDTYDKFPQRSRLGRYLHERYHSIADVLKKAGVLEVVFGKVIETDWRNKRFAITLATNAIFFSKEVVLAIGHQTTKNDAQINNWITYTEDSKFTALIQKPYPIEKLLQSDGLTEKSVVAMRGFGLAMIDVMRALTTGLGGQFNIVDKATRAMSYQRSGKEPKQLIPFSLDGLPMAPKPLNFKIDQWFFPTAKEKEDFGGSVQEIAQKGVAKNAEFIIQAIVPIIARVYGDLGNRKYAHELSQKQLSEVIHAWLANADYTHELIVAADNPAEKSLEAYVGMATATKTISLDFCIGHVWRHCQPTMYKAVSFSNLADEVIAEIVQLDERLKRYSYGPPVDSIQQLLALIKAGVVCLDFVNDPEIKTTAEGWKFAKSGQSICANTLVNTVLDAPKLLEIDTPLVAHLLHKSLIAPIHNELGVDTYENARVVLAKTTSEIPLAVLGRLSKGTLLGVDAILECFGQRSELWAEGVIQRLMAEA